ncbi:MAG: hypothetical protein FWD84_04105, partial [Oscillospiraceae bacterium]|nr:hypothetical protein [Oscillospiraceae bacterium]
MALSERKKRILKTVVEAYIDSAEPVSSKALQGRLDLGVSSATIRNEMNDLEQMGLLEQPHTSAGRTPTAQGYRIYVNELMGHGDVPSDEAEVIRGRFPRADGPDRVVSDVSKL